MGPVTVAILDEALLRDIGLQTLKPGDRYNLAYDTSGIAPVAGTAIKLRDTTVISLDSTGVLHARSAGTAWILWPHGEAEDSAAVTVSADVPSTSEDITFTAPRPVLKTVDVRYPTGRTRGVEGKQWRVAQGENLQAALNAAQPGDEIVLAQGAVFNGNFTLPAKSGNSSDWIIIRSEVLPVAAGTRVTPTLAAGVAKVVTNNQDPAIVAAKGARRWRLVGFEVAHGEGAVYNYGILVLGWGNESTLAQLPTDIVLDRMYVHGNTVQGNSRCIAMNGRSQAVINSWLSECHAKGQDAQAVWGAGGTGPYLIENNQLEASGQGVMFGGADPAIAGVSPSDIVIRRNHFYKPYTWARGKWSVKATFELKHARRVMFEYNVLENEWADAQDGYAILFQSLSQYNNAPQSTVEDVMVRNNIIRNSASGAVLLGRASSIIVSPTSRIAFLNNLWENVGRDPVKFDRGTIFLLLGNIQDVTIANNTVTLDSTSKADKAVYFDGFGGARTTIMNNLFPASQYGVAGSNIGEGTVALAAYAVVSKFLGNIVPGQAANTYPGNNFFPSNGPRFQGMARTTYTGVCELARGWMDGQLFPTSVGANCADLEPANLSVVSGTPN